MLRRIVLFLLLTPLILPAQDSVRRRQRPTQSPPSKPVQYQYEVNTETTTEMPEAQMDFLSMVPGLANRNVRTVAWFTIVTQDSARGKVYRLTLDSLHDNSNEALAGLTQMMDNLGGIAGASGEADSMLQAGRRRLEESMAFPPPGSTIYRFVRDGRPLLTRYSLQGNLKLMALAGALDELVPSPKMLTARWNDSWTENAGVSTPSGAEGLPIKQSGATRWRVTGKDTIDAVIATSMDMLADSAAIGDLVSSATDDSARVAALGGAPMSLRGSVKGTKRVILASNKSVRKVTSSIETVTNVGIPIGGIGSIKSRATSKMTLTRIP